MKPNPQSRVSTPVATVVLTTAGAVIVLAGMKAIASILAPTLLALFLLILFRPIAVALERRGWPKALTMVITLILIYGVLFGMGLTVYLAVSYFATTLIQDPAQFNALIASGTKLLSSIGVSTSDVSSLASGVSPARIASVARSLVSASAAVAGAVALVVALAFFMALDAANFSNRLRLTTRFRPAVAGAFVGLGRSTRSYFAVAAIFGAIVGVVDWILLTIVGVPDAWLWALLAFVTNFIPNIGFIIGLIPPAILALITLDWQSALVVVVGYIVINVVIQVLIQPKVVGDTVQLNTTLTFLALVVWTWVLGGLGALLAIPMTLLVRALLIDSRPDLRWVRMLFASPGAPSPPKPGRPNPPTSAAASSGSPEPPTTSEA